MSRVSHVGTIVELWLPKATTAAATLVRSLESSPPLAPTTEPCTVLIVDDDVLTDHAMPSMTGLQLAEFIHTRFPGLPIILATGYAELPVDPATLGIARLAKPCTQHEIAAAIHRAVRAGAVPERVALSGGAS